MEELNNSKNQDIKPKNEEPGALKPAKSRKKLIVIILIVIALAFAVFAAFKFATDDKNDQGKLKNCKDREVSFTSLPVAKEQFAHFVPMGQVMDGHVTPTDHVYLIGKGAPETNTLLMPADGTVTTVSAMPAQYVGDRQQQVASEDYRIEVAHNCRYGSIFIHVHKLSPALASAVGKLEPNQSKDINIELKAGEPIGKFGQSVDWTLTDQQTKLTGFITPKLYEREAWKIHTIDPVSVYSGNAKNDMIALSLRTVEPYGGKIDYDKPGAAVGNWFREGTNGYEGAIKERYWDGHLSIAPNHIDPTAITVSLGNWNGKAAQFTAKQAINPATVTKANGPVAYELIDIGYVNPAGQALYGTSVKGMKMIQAGPVRGTVLVQVLEDEKLKVENFPGKSAVQVTGFTSAAQIYTR